MLIHPHSIYMFIYELAHHIRFYNKSFLCKWQKILRPRVPKASLQSPRPRKSPKIKAKTPIPSLGRSNDARPPKNSHSKNSTNNQRRTNIVSHSKQVSTLWSCIKLILSKKIIRSTNPSATCSLCTWKKKKNAIKKCIPTSHSHSFRCSSSCWERRNLTMTNAASANSSTKSPKTTKTSW